MVCSFIHYGRPCQVKKSFEMLCVSVQGFAIPGAGSCRTNAPAKRTVSVRDVAACMETCWRCGNGGCE